MTISVKHAFASPKSDGTDSTLVQPSNWNAEHTFTAAAGKVIGRDSSGAGAIQELPLSFDATGQSMIPPSGTTASRPATPAAGMLRYNTTTAKMELYANSAWGAVGGGATVSGTAPSSPSTGDLWYNSTTGALQVYNGSAWVTFSGNLTVDAFSGNGSTTAFTLSGSPGSINSTDVYVSGVYQAKSTYTLSGTTLTFSTAPPTGANNIQVEWGAALAIGTPSDGTVTTVKIADANVTTAKIADANITTAKIADANVTTAKIANANVTVAKLSATGTASATTYLRGDGAWGSVGVTFGTSVASTSGTAIDFVNIPSTARRITIIMSGVSLNGTGTLILRIGAGSIVTTGYASGIGSVDAGGYAGATSAIGFTLASRSSGTATIRHGSIVLHNVAGNTWVATVTFGHSDSSNGTVGGGSLTLSGVLDRVRLTESAGINPFDAGTVNIAWE